MYIIRITVKSVIGKNYNFNICNRLRQRKTKSSKCEMTLSLISSVATHLTVNKTEILKLKKHILQEP